MQRKLIYLVLLGLGSFTVPSLSQAADATGGSTEERLVRLERMVRSQGLVDILMRLESLQKDVQQMQGDNEVQSHTLDEIRKRQRELYIDIDRRLLQLERGQTGSAPVKKLSPVKEPVAASDTTGSAAGKSAETMDGTAESTMIVAGGKPTGGGVRSGLPEAEMEKPVESEQTAYQKAFDLLRELRYDKANEAFRKFIKTYPEGRYAHIAQYWLAEANYAQRKFDVAIVDYQKLIDTYAGSPKRAEAMLKIGYSYYELKQYQKAQAILEQLLASYPGTTEAGQAQNLLQKIKINNAS